jgi:hypothetical protein
MAVIKAIIRLPEITAEECHAMIGADEVRREWDTFIIETEILDKKDDYLDNFYFVVPSPTMLVSRRDFVCKRIMFPNYKGADYFTYMRHMVHPKKGDRPKHVRGKILNFGRVIRRTKDNKGCTVTMVASVDIGGSIPKWIVNMKASSGPKETLDNIKKHFPILKKKGLIEGAIKKIKAWSEAAAKFSQVDPTPVLTMAPQKVEAPVEAPKKEVAAPVEAPKKEETGPVEAPKTEEAAPQEDSGDEEPPAEYYEELEQRKKEEEQALEGQSETVAVTVIIEETSPDSIPPTKDTEIQKPLESVNQETNPEDVPPGPPQKKEEEPEKPAE